MEITPHAQPRAIPTTRVNDPRIKTNTMPVGGTMKVTKLVNCQQYIPPCDDIRRHATHHAKKVAVPILCSDGPMNINSDATQAAREQRKSTLRSRALKWSSHAGNFRWPFALGDGLAWAAGSSVLDEEPGPASGRVGSVMGGIALNHERETEQDGPRP